ncbi:MAG: hypothetical protein IJ706_03080 [Clostridia bacterium]|nr:hypothetical protein [Clostridia bacterium]
MTVEEWTKKREDIKLILQREEYGFIPEKPLSMNVEELSSYDNFCAGKASLKKMKMTCEVKGGTVEFPFTYVKLHGIEKQKTMILINFSGEVPDKYNPTEEIVERGWALAAFDYQGLTSDIPNRGREINADKNALALGFDKDETAPGKIAIWAWGAMRILDYLLTLPETDGENVGVIGHSRLGKTALVAGAFDDRFKFVRSNCSGTCGASLFNDANERSESIEKIYTQFPYWFCKNFGKYMGKDKEMPFDQDMLASLVAPRYLSIGSAELDLWANPASEMNCARKASYAWEICGKDGLVAPTAAKADEWYHAGNVGYDMRSGTHYLSRRDWNAFLSFCEGKL